MALPRPDRSSQDVVRVGFPSRDRLSPGGRSTRGRSSGGISKRKSYKEAALRRRRFAVVVVLPALLMIGSVYVHTVSAGVQEQIDGLEERLARAKAEKQELEVRISELSQPGRVREGARQLGMRDAAGADIEVYAKDGEDGTDNRGEAGTHAAP
jgi:cell division protein FtsL